MENSLMICSKVIKRHEEGKRKDGVMQKHSKVNGNKGKEEEIWNQ